MNWETIPLYRSPPYRQWTVEFREVLDRRWNPYVTCGVVRGWGSHEVKVFGDTKLNKLYVRVQVGGEPLSVTYVRNISETLQGFMYLGEEDV